jgi:hypothetical protein
MASWDCVVKESGWTWRRRALPYVEQEVGVQKKSHQQKRGFMKRSGLSSSRDIKDAS